MDAIFSFFQTNYAFLSIIATLIVAILTLLYVRITSKTLKEMQLTREQETRPYVSVFLSKEPRHRHIDLYIKNYGKTGAKIKSIDCSPDINLFGKTLNTTFNNTVLMPGQSIYTVVKDTDSVKSQGSFLIKCCYNSINSEAKEYCEEYSIDVSYFKQLGYSEVNSTNLESSENSLKHISDALDIISKKSI